MKGEDRKFRSRDESVAGEVVDGEAVVIDLTSGAYYSLNEAGTLVWQVLISGHDVGEAAAALARRFTTTPEEAAADTGRLVDQLEEEGLIVPRDPAQPAGEAPAWPGGERQPYRPAALEVYRDLGALLALDPPTPKLVDGAAESVGHDRDD
jgi:hypothetical protein